MRSFVRERWAAISPYVLPALVLALALAAIGWRFWTRIEGAHRSLAWDAQWEYWGDLRFQIDAWKHGELPLWNPFDRCGYPFAADPQTGVLYPPNWLLIVTGMITGAKFWLVTAKTMIHLWWLSFGTFVWLRRRGTPSVLCCAAGVFCIVAYPTNAWFSAINWGIAWVPWILFAIDRWADAPSRRTAAWLALALAMCELAGSPPAMWYALLVAVPYAAWAVYDRARATERRAYMRAIAATGAIALGLFVILVGGQWITAKALLPHTVRATRDLDFIASQGLLPDDLLGMVVPRMPGQNIYLGIVAVLAAAAALTLRPSGRSYVLAAICALGLLLAMGPHNVFLSSFASFMPLATLFRLAQRYAYVLVVPFAALGAESVATLAALEAGELRARAARWLAIAGGAGAALAAVGIASTDRGATHDAYVYALFAWVIGTWVLRQIVTADPAWRPRYVVLAAVVLALEMWFAHAPDHDQALWPKPTTTADHELRGLPGVPLGVRIFDRDHYKFRVGTRMHVRELGGYEGDPLALERYAKLMDRVYQDPHVLGHANVGFVAGTGGPDSRKLALGEDFPAVAPDVFHVPAIAPAVAWYPTAYLVDNEPAAMAALPSLRPGTAAILERSSLRSDELAAIARLASHGAPVAGRFVAYDRNELEADIDAPAPGVVVIAEMFHPGWHATVDGVPARVVPANGAFRGVLVAAGHHRIAMTFEAGLAGWLMMLSPLGLAGALVLALRRPRAAS